MKRLFCILLSLCFLLSGCSFWGERIKDPVVFYYIRDDFQKDMESVISSETREAAGHRNDLPYLLALYSMGPSTEGFLSPIPNGTKISPTEHTPDGIVLTLTDEAANMTDAEYTLASACIAMTCMELTDATKITVSCGERSITITENNLLLDDPSHLKQLEVHE